MKVFQFKRYLLRNGYGVVKKCQIILLDLFGSLTQVVFITRQNPNFEIIIKILSGKETQRFLKRLFF